MSIGNFTNGSNSSSILFPSISFPLAGEETKEETLTTSGVQAELGVGTCTSKAQRLSSGT